MAIKNLKKIFRNKIFITTILACFISVSGAFSYSWLLGQREKREWPFNSGLSKYLPNYFKRFGYEITNPDQAKISSFLYKISAEYAQVPSPTAVDGGGGIANLSKDLVIVVTNSGHPFVFDYSTKKFTEIKNNKINNRFLSVRDIEVFDDGGEKHLAIFGTREHDSNCKFIGLYTTRIEFKDNTGAPSLPDFKKIWQAENVCSKDSGLNNSSFGGRVVFNGKEFLVSTSFAIGSGDVSDNPEFPQDLNSNYGKIIKVQLDGTSKIVSWGHRAPQGLFFSPSGKLMSTEHAMRGGDELNEIKQGSNYGYPCETFSTPYKYDFTKPPNNGKLTLRNSQCTSGPYEGPKFVLGPTTGISQGISYSGQEFKAWTDNLLIASLAGLSIFNLKLNQKEDVIFVDRIKVNERVRDLTILPNGKIAFITDGGSLVILQNSLKPTSP